MSGKRLASLISKWTSGPEFLRPFRYLGDVLVAGYGGSASF